MQVTNGLWIHYYLHSFFFFHNQLQSGYHHILKIVHNIYTAYEQKYLMVETCSSDVLYLCECIVLVFR